MIWIAFLACLTVILFAGTQLARNGDIIAEKTGWGRTWVGIVLLASVTSLPELVTGISSVTIFDTPNIALGDIFGSCMFNLSIVALLDALERQQPISARLHEGQALSASFSVFMLGTVAIGLLGRDAIPTVGWIGLPSLILMGLYAASMRAVFKYEKNRIAQFVREIGEEANASKVTLQSALKKYAINSALVIAAASLLPKVGAEIAAQTGLSRTFVGTLFIAASTSLPEVVVAVAALRLNAPDMAVGNIFGSNMFNMAILAIDDFAYVKGSLLLNAAPDHIVSIVAAITMTAIATAGITYRIRAKSLLVSWDSLGIVGTYVVALYVLHSRSGAAF